MVLRERSSLISSLINALMSSRLISSVPGPELSGHLVLANVVVADGKRLVVARKKINASAATEMKADEYDCKGG
jgi:hypothetical protein